MGRRNCMRKTTTAPSLRWWSIGRFLPAHAQCGCLMEMKLILDLILWQRWLLVWVQPIHCLDGTLPLLSCHSYPLLSFAVDLNPKYVYAEIGVCGQGVTQRLPDQISNCSKCVKYDCLCCVLC